MTAPITTATALQPTPTTHAPRPAGHSEGSAAAQAPFPAWAALPPTERARWLERLADAIEARLDDFAHAEARDGGKPYALARDAEIPRAISNLRFFAHPAPQFSS